MRDADLQPPRNQNPAPERPTRRTINPWQSRAGRTRRYRWTPLTARCGPWPPARVGRAGRAGARAVPPPGSAHHDPRRGLARRRAASRNRGPGARGAAVRGGGASGRSAGVSPRRRMSCAPAAGPACTSPTSRSRPRLPGRSRRSRFHAMRTPQRGNDKAVHRAVHAERDESRKGPGDAPAPKRHLRPLPRPRTARPAPHDDHGGALIRRLMKETFLKSRPAIEVALRRRFSNPATVQDCLELLARLEGELP
jgi:hypothetical protein